jgi:hypothetical protein
MKKIEVVAGIIIILSYSLGYHQTKINFNILGTEFNNFPIGYISIFASCFITFVSKNARHQFIFAE